MKYWLIVFILFSTSGYSGTSRFDCKYVDYFLELETGLSSQITHELKINGNIPIVELTKGKWFIESVNCQKSGFEIIASHAQFGRSQKRLFRLGFSKKKGYALYPNL